MDDES